jgi:hypothetical protein
MAVNPYDPTTTPNTTPSDYYSQLKYNYQPYSYTNTPFGGQGAFGAGGSNPYPTMTQNEPNSGLPAPTGTNQQAAGGLFQPPDWLSQPQESVIRAMRQQGFNPGSFNPVTQQILRNSQNLVNTLFGQSAGMADQSQMPDLSNQDLMLGKLGDLIKGAAGGGRVFGGFAPQTLANFSQAVAASNAGTGNLNQNAIAAYLYNQGNPNQALNLAQSLLYGGLAQPYQTAAAAPLVNLGDYYKRLLEQGQDYNRTVLDILLGAPVAGKPAGSPGVPLPFQTSAWRYNPTTPTP